MAETTTATGARTFRLEVISPEGVLYDLQVRSIVAPGEDGKLGVLYNHAPLVTPLVPDVLEITTAEGERRLMATGEGFLEVVDNQVRVLVDSAERPEEIDVERARSARQRARDRLARRGPGTDIDFTRAEAALRRAMARLRATGSS